MGNACPSRYLRRLWTVPRFALFRVHSILATKQEWQAKNKMLSPTCTKAISIEENLRVKTAPLALLQLWLPTSGREKETGRGIVILLVATNAERFQATTNSGQLFTSKQGARKTTKKPTITFQIYNVTDGGPPGFPFQTHYTLHATRRKGLTPTDLGGLDLPDGPRH